MSLAEPPPFEQDLVARRDRAAIEKTIHKLLDCTSLKRHFSIAAEIIDAIGDVTPTELVADVFEWLKPRLSDTPASWAAVGTFTNAWKAVLALMRGLGAEQKRLVCDIAIAHPWWSGATTNREWLIRAVNACSATADEQQLRVLADAALPLALSGKNNVDYVHAVNLLTAIAQSGSDSIRASMAEKLYPSDTPVPALLLQVISHFGREPTGASKVNEWAEKAAAEIEMQVQRLEVDAEPTPIPYSLGNLVSTKGGRKVVVQIGGGELQLACIAPHAKSLQPVNVQKLLDAVLVSALDPDNTLGNRAGLIHSMEKYARFLSQTQAQTIIDRLLSTANGSITEPEGVMTTAQAADPLNPFKLASGDPDDLQGAALLLISEVTNHHPVLLTRAASTCIETATLSERPRVRRYGFVAAARSPRRQAFLAAVVAGTRDSDASAARAAFQALAAHPDLVLTMEIATVLSHSLRVASYSPDTAMRAAAASLLVRYINKLTSLGAGAVVSEVSRAFQADVSHWVREIAGGLTGSP